MLLRVEGILTITDLPPGCAFAEPDELADLVARGLAREVVRTKNKVVSLGLSAVSRLIGFGLALPDVTNGTQTYPVADVDDLRITAMKFGNASNPTAPAAADFQLFDPTIMHTVTPTVAYPGNAQVRWRGVIPAVGFTGQGVTEEGLFISNGALFARTTFAASVMLPGQAKQFDHTLILTTV
jgi:hypothetical protein